MAKTVILRVRVDPTKAASAKKVLKRLGLTETQAVNMMLAQIHERKALPFPVALPTSDNSDILLPRSKVQAALAHLDES
jgi:addiction module RelB/DinJ family antitoxin